MLDTLRTDATPLPDWGDFVYLHPSLLPQHLTLSRGDNPSNRKASQPTTDQAPTRLGGKEGGANG